VFLFIHKNPERNFKKAKVLKNQTFSC